MYLVSFRASTGKNKKKYVKTQKYAQWRRRKGRFRQGRAAIAARFGLGRPSCFAPGQGSGVRRNSSGALSLRHRTAKTKETAAALRSNSSGTPSLRPLDGSNDTPFAAKGIFVRDYRAHSTKTALRTSFCTAKGKFRPLFAFRGKRHPPPAAV